jgi:tRNA(Ile)-lysidine synthase
MDLPPLPVEAPRRLLVGFSGGRDSVALLHRLATQQDAPWTSLRAVHVDHGLHPDSAAWATHCRAVAESLGVPLAVHRVSVARGAEGPEAAARAARYAAFAAERGDDECLVLAHHRDDQAETLLLALLRGSGERGLSAMRAFVVDGRGPIWRPLLDTPAEVVARYAEAHALRVIDDPSNADTALSRNALRHELLPLLRRRWPQADAALAHSARALAEADALLEAQAQADLAPLLGLDASVLDAAGLRALAPARAQRALRAWAAMHSVGLSRDAIERVLGGWRGMPAGRALRHAQGPHWLRQWQGRLWLTPRRPAAARGGGATGNATDPPTHWSGREPLPLADGGALRLLGADGFEAPLILAPRALAPPALRSRAGRPPRRLQAVFAELGLPPWRRESVPLLVAPDDRLVAVGDLAYDAGFDAWLRARGARLLWQPGADAN